MSRSLAILCAVMLSACAKQGTFVILDFPSAPAASITSIQLSLSLDGATATETLSPPSGSLAFPTSSSLEIGSAQGDLAVTASAMAGTSIVATAMGMVTVVRGTTVHLPLPFGMSSSDDGGAAGALAISPGSFDYGTIVVGSMSSDKHFTITNTGTMTSGALQVSIVGTDTSDFSIAQTDCTGKTLAMNETCGVDAHFSPQTAGASKSVTLQVSGTPGGTASAMLSGNAGPKGDLTISPLAQAYPPTPVGNQSTEIAFTVTNGGTTATSSIAVAISGTDSADFEKTTDTCNGQLLGGSQSCTIKVLSSPTKRGALAATLSAFAVKGGTAVANLTGTGQIDAVLTITGGATMGARADLGTVDVGSIGTMTHNFTIRNDGDFVSGPLVFSAVPTMNTEIFATAGVGYCMAGMQLDPGASCMGQLALQPTSFGQKTIDVTISATPGGSVSTYMQGIGHDQVSIGITQTLSGDGSSGTVTDNSSPSVLDCGSSASPMVCLRVFDRTTSAPQVSLIATADPGSTFVQWTGVCSASPSTNPCAITLDASVASGSTISTSATWKKNTFALTYNRTDYQYTNTASALGTFTVPGAACNGPCSGTIQVAAGSTVNIVSAPDANPLPGGGFALRQISGACSASSKTSANASCVFVMNAPMTVNTTYSAHNYAFVTSNLYPTKLNTGVAVPPPNTVGLTGADAKCQAEADAVGLPGTFVAFLSSSNTDAKSRFGTAVTWLRSDGRPFAASIAALTTNLGVLYPLSLDASGVPHDTDNVLSATTDNGLKESPGCSDWTDNTIAGGPMCSGRVGSAAPEWTDYQCQTGACTSFKGRLYCLGTDLANPMDKLPITNARLAFVTSTTFTPGGTGGIGNLDALCTAAAATNPSLTGHVFKAFAAGDPSAVGQTAGGRFSAAGNNWVRLDGVTLAATPANLVGSPFLPIAALDVNESGNHLGTVSRVWTGSPNPTVTPFTGDDCATWTSGTGEAGYSDRVNGNATDFSGFFGNSMALEPCTNAHNVYCLEQ